MTSARILVTGSRWWASDATVERALLAALTIESLDAPILVHGACPTGADQLADALWTRWMRDRPGDLLKPERYPGRNFPTMRDRNQHMVDRGATVCLTFADTWASGTGMTARMARRAGIRTIDYGVDTRAEARPPSLGQRRT